MNPTPINTTNVKAFGFSTTFKLYQKKIVFDITGLTQFVAGGQVSALKIFFDVIDPLGGLITSENHLNSDISLPGNSVFEVPIRDMNFGFGIWEIKGTIREVNGREYSIRFTKEICKPEGFEGLSVKGKFVVDVNCYSPYINISEETKLIYSKNKPVSQNKTGKLFYPQGTLDVVNFDFTPMQVVDVFTGEYLIKNTTTAVYSLKDNVFVEIKYFTNQKFEVNCTGTMSSIVCCIDDVASIYQKDPGSERGRDAKSKIDKIGLSVMQAVIKEKAGISSDKEIAYIKDILNCECGCGDLVEPFRIGNSEPVPNIQIQGGCGVNVLSSVGGNTKNFIVSSKTTQLTKDELDLSFVLSKTESNCGFNYVFSFNYEVLSETILNTIKGSEQLTDLLKSILEDAFASNGIEELDGRCVFNAATSNYLLIENTSGAGVTYVTGITIGGQLYNAPDNLSILSTSQFQIWLNSLNKGQFSVSRDNVNSTVIISSQGNQNVVSTLKLTLISGTGTTNLIRVFNVTGRSLVNVLQALVDAVCDLNEAKVQLSKNYIVKRIDSSGNIISDQVLVGTGLDGLLDKILDSLSKLTSLTRTSNLSCSRLKELFIVSNNQISVGIDRLYGVKNNVCSSLSFQDVARAVLEVISVTPSLRNTFCNIVSLCSVDQPGTCNTPTNISVDVVDNYFQFNYQLPGDENKIEVEVLYPDNSVQTVTNNGNSGPFAIPINSNTPGIFRFRARTVCDDTISPNVVSPYSDYYDVNISRFVSAGAGSPDPNTLRIIVSLSSTANSPIVVSFTSTYFNGQDTINGPSDSITIGSGQLSASVDYGIPSTASDVVVKITDVQPPQYFTSVE